MNDLQTRIEQLFKRSGKKKGVVCQNIGITRSTLSNYLKAGKIRSYQIAVKLAEELGTNAEYLLKGDEETHYRLNTDANVISQLKADNALSVPVVEEIDHKELNLAEKKITEYIPVPKFALSGWNKKHIFATVMTGDSMHPRITRGAYVLSSCERQISRIDKKHIAVTSINNGGHIKSVSFKRNGIQLVPENNKFKEQFLTNKEIRKKNINLFPVLGFMEY
ncbi:S24 family peptidase [Candidatus Auribacterota bacterium]